MSIYGSLEAPDDDSHEDDCARWEKHDNIWEVSDRPCDCGQPDAPLVYQGSHILPADTDKRGGAVDIACIGSHITRDGRDNGSEDQGPWPYLRLGVNEGTVVLTRRNVEQIHKTLSWWLEAARSGDA